MLEYGFLLGLNAPAFISLPPAQSMPPADSQPPAQSEAPADSAAPAESAAPVESEAPVQSGAPAQSEAPVESQASAHSQAPAEDQAPVESEAPAERETPAVTEIIASPDINGLPGPAPLPAGVWIGLGAALAAAVIGAFLLMLRKRRKPPVHTAPESPPASPSQLFVTERPAGEAPPPPAVQIGKLHQQGARPGQQDCFCVSPEDIIPTHGLLAVVADGMGGLSDGDKVSQTAVSAIINGFFIVQGEPDYVLLTLLEQANHQVNRLLGPDGYSRSGSTLVAGLARNGFFHFLSVGDSRVCLYRDGALYQLNREHVFRRELELRAVNREEDLAAAAAHPKAAGLTSYLGMGRLKYVDMPDQPVAIRPGDKFILMSDGVYNALAQDELTACLDHEPQQAALALDQAIRAKNYSNQDNYTAVILGF